MSLIYWDTMLFVYLLEGHPEHSTRVKRILTRMEQRKDTLCTSIFTIGELLVTPYRLQAFQAIQKIREAMRPPSVEILPFAAGTAERYAAIRAELRVSPADAIHLACAAEAGADVFLTNDQKLAGRIVPGIQFIVGMDSNLF